ncbi:MAG: SRPBCC family protein [Firmicutes bacterium]|nr:SRPBCC family protein [Bacillota bacterium]
MCQFAHSITTKAKAETIWELYRDITSWTTWDEGIEYVTLDGPFAAGTLGVLQAKGQDKMSFQLTEVEPLHGFSDVTDILAAGIAVLFTHRLQKTLDGTRITHAVTVMGSNAEKFGPQFITEVSQGIPRTMERLAALALEQDKKPSS